MGFLSNKIWVRIFLGHPLEVLHSLIMKITAKAIDVNDIVDVSVTADLQTRFRLCWTEL